MARQTPAEDLNAIEDAVRARPGVTSPELADILGDQVPRRTLQHRLKGLVDRGRLIREGDRRWARYRTPDAAPPRETRAAEDTPITLSPESEEMRTYLRAPTNARAPVGYKREFLDSYRPGETFYLPEAARAAG